MKQSFQNKRVLVIGLGLSGRASSHFLLKQGASVYGVDRSQELLDTNLELSNLRKNGLQVAHESIDLDIKAFDLVVASPGVPQSHPLWVKAQHFGISVIGEMELACRGLSQRFIGITGTNGKTTVTLMVTHVLNSCGISAKALGNIGLPLTAEVEKLSPNDVIVAELSSFQLETLESPVIDAAVILNITPDHLDRYATMEDYAKAKIRIQKCLKPSATCLVEEGAYRNYQHLFDKEKVKTYGYSPKCDFFNDQNQIFFQQKIEQILPLEYRGLISHDVENWIAAYALCRVFEIAPEQFIKAASTFRKPSHRIEFVKSLRGVDYYDDSKGTNIDAVIRAVQSLKGKIVLIAGGVDKGSAYTPWIAVFKDKVKCICAIGQAAEKIKKDLCEAVPVEIFDSLDAAVENAALKAEKGESVLLSPGCSSFDMFKDYAHRGDEFKRIVNAL